MLLYFYATYVYKHSMWQCDLTVIAHPYADWAIEGMARRVMSVKVDRRHRCRGVYSTSSACKADKGKLSFSPHLNKPNVINMLPTICQRVHRLK